MKIKLTAVRRYVFIAALRGIQSVPYMPVTTVKHDVNDRKASGAADPGAVSKNLLQVGGV
jgi:hypothetical protein